MEFHVTIVYELNNIADRRPLWDAIEIITVDSRTLGDLRQL